jgi:uncharacterized protein YhfF/RimJ/RimL family protein N-acetyltransferase
MAEPAEKIVENLVPKAGAVTEFWEAFCRATGVPVGTPYQAWYFGDSPAMAHELVELVLYGPKRATAASVWLNEIAPEAAAVPDGYSVVTEHDGRPRAVIRTTWLETRPLAEVDAQFAWDEGEGDRTLPDWLDGHTRWFKRECERLGRHFSPTMPVALERFELLYPFDRALAVPDGPRIVPCYLPGAIGTIGRLHGEYYAREHGFGVQFESKVTREFAEFVVRFDPKFDGIWFVVQRGEVHGSIVIDGHGGSGSAHLRWFMLSDAIRGRGQGSNLMDAAMAFCRRAGHRHVYLNTFKGLDAARALYERAGFQLVAEETGTTWGRAVIEQRFEWTA